MKDGDKVEYFPSGGGGGGVTGARPLQGRKSISKCGGDTQRRRSIFRIGGGGGQLS